ncbi:MAG: lytic murein transglycosylase [Deltaproteobacteria bacterium]
MARSRFWGVVTGALLALLAMAVGVRAEAPPVAYAGLKYGLVRQGLSKDYVLQTFADPRNQFLPDIVRKIAYLRKESPAIYKKFLTPAVVAQGRAYLETHRAILHQAEARFGVAPEVIVAILTVESNLGSNTGKYPVFNVFASLAVMRELATFLRYCAIHQVVPFSLCGSWAGAMGFCQFLPSSLNRCGVAADGTGPVDLFTHDDAIFSIACYLHKSGFNLNNRASWRRAVYSYNHSEAYVDTVLTLAQRY